MPTSDPSDKVFAGSVPALYDQFLVPLIFEPYAKDLVTRVAAYPLTRVLEIAAGTGVVTRHLASTLAADVAIVATDLNPPMLAKAAAVGTPRPVEWKEADAMQLPFADASFDAVVCQFGAMFFPDKSKAFAEARRVLRNGGVLLFNVWDRIEENEFADVATRALATLFPADPPRFLARAPHGYHDVARIRSDLSGGGFDNAADVDTVAARSVAASASVAAIAFCQGSPLRAEIEARDASGLAAATRSVERALAARFGDASVDAKIQAHVIAVRR